MQYVKTCLCRFDSCNGDSVYSCFGLGAGAQQKCRQAGMQVTLATPLSPPCLTNPDQERGTQASRRGELKGHLNFRECDYLLQVSCNCMSAGYLPCSRARERHGLLLFTKAVGCDCIGNDDLLYSLLHLTIWNLSLLYMYTAAYRGYCFVFI